MGRVGRFAFRAPCDARAPLSRSGDRLCLRFVAFTEHVVLGLRAGDAGTDLDVHRRITDGTVDSAGFIAGIEEGFGFGQSLDDLAADSDDNDTRSTE
ncbi:hypothetical protein [Thermomonospora umbrina]|uniref:hypothetical protein n=1 Tax=Thermomonospora umbrina TaxID=111806 RepID=UPI001FE7EED1|nr:hypothetical protein [Thermomonospora umbrina]